MFAISDCLQLWIQWKMSALIVLCFFVSGISRLKESPGELFCCRTKAGCSIQLWQPFRINFTCFWPAVSLQFSDHFRGSRRSKADSSHIYSGTAEMWCTRCQRSSCRGPLCEWLPHLSVCGHPWFSVRQTQAKSSWCASRASAELSGGAAITASAAHGLMPSSHGLKCKATQADCGSVKVLITGM